MISKKMKTKADEIKRDFFIQNAGYKEYQETPYFLNLNEDGDIVCSLKANGKTIMLWLDKELNIKEQTSIEDPAALTFCLYDGGLLCVGKESIGWYDKEGVNRKKILDIDDLYYADIKYIKNLGGFLYFKSNLKQLSILSPDGNIRPVYDYADTGENFSRYAIHSDLVYMVGWSSNAVSVVDLNGKPVKQIGIPLENDGWSAIEVDERENVYLCNYFNSEIIKFSQEGNLIYRYHLNTKGYNGKQYNANFYHMKMTPDKGRLYVTDAQKKIWKFLLKSE